MITRNDELKFRIDRKKTVNKMKYTIKKTSNFKFLSKKLQKKNEDEDWGGHVANLSSLR